MDTISNSSRMTVYQTSKDKFLPTALINTEILISTSLVNDEVFLYILVIFNQQT